MDQRNRNDPRSAIVQWVDDSMQTLSQWNQMIFDFGETAWREYRSVDWYVNRMREEGFVVEEGSGGMPTAFCAIWDNGEGPVIGGYAEYDGVPGNCQAADTVRRPRDGLSEYAGGHTDPHSALGIASLGGFLAAKMTMEQYRIPGTLKFFGEPAEKVRGSKPIHAAAGYYDDLDAAISFHPFYMLPLCNTVRWNTHCGAAYAVIYSFHCNEPETWLSSDSAAVSPIPAAHASVRAPGANDALVMMYQTSKSLREHMISSGCGWSMNECILTAGQATADCLPARLAQIQYIVRVPDVEYAEQVLSVLDQNARAAALVNHCTYERHWVSKSRPGLANHTLAQAAYRNLESVGPPVFHHDKARAVAQEIQHNLGLDPMEMPFLEATETLISPQDAEDKLRHQIPAWQEHFTSDDYTEYCWHAPTVRLYVARPALAPPEPNYRYPDWVMNALGGIPETIDPMINCAAKTIGLTICDLLTQPELLNAAKEEFVRRTGGGLHGHHWLAPLCDYPPPIHFRWPEYVTTSRGTHWWMD